MAQYFEKWQITALVSLALLVGAISILLCLGATEEAMRTYVRVSAQISVVLFLLAFSACSLQALFRRAWSGWLLRNRRYIGVSFALAHSTHFAALVLLAVFFPHPFMDKLTAATVVGGLSAYVIILMMAITSFEGPRRALGERGWKWLHLYGSWYLWVLFAYSYVPRALKDGFYIPFAVLIFVVLGLRIVRFLKPRAGKPLEVS